MCKEKIVDNRTRQCGHLPLPDIPEEAWCDFRRDYESGMTLKRIAEKYYCDSRTVKSCILNNKSSTELGSQKKPTKIAAYIDLIDTEFQKIISDQSFTSEGAGICEISEKITEMIQQSGYDGSERTVRNYLRITYQFPRDPEEPGKESGNDQD